ncbi:hypothetical protein HN371_03460 [Candidatus Poribacteria bacterium]|jgi:hypothetical protein|nr:hypothetical protein [Candidatus Poribacteria bacterium]MBT5533593.1 hypothetical protein [Candidatus Poribacteria bacterium]MBT5712957.1 hypothetical protein [Candidatus Poribacteria bacterium]MBT7100219.1 hypothetical protein [Candidatus Poribacteria bacterium]MBT7808438.1 hypothetical protein [Candidatus Poribacteria bacterium]
MRATTRLLLACWAFAVAWGCGEEEEPVIEAAYVHSVRPAPGSTVCPRQDITVVFSRDPGAVRATRADLEPAEQSGTVRTLWAGYYTPIELAWGDDSTLTVDYRYLPCDPQAPTVIRAFPEVGVPVPVADLEARGIVLAFDEDMDHDDFDWPEELHVTGPPGWLWDAPVTVDGAVVTVGPPEPGVFEPGQTYTLRGTVRDRRHGIQTGVRLTITTEGGGP